MMSLLLLREILLRLRGLLRRITVDMKVLDRVFLFLSILWRQVGEAQTLRRRVRTKEDGQERIRIRVQILFGRYVVF